jgi:hypothetical protein
MMRRTAWFALLLTAVCILAVGCSDDDDGGGEATPTATLAAAVTPASTTAPTVAPTIDPSITPGPAATLELSASPQRLVCDGSTVSTVRARVLDEAGVPVADGTAVHFDVQALGTADPINAETESGVATTSLTARGEGVGVVVNVSAGDAAAAIRIDCL